MSPATTWAPRSASGFAFAGDRASTRTRAPSPSRRRARLEPRNPVAPVTSTVPWFMQMAPGVPLGVLGLGVLRTGMFCLGVQGLQVQWLGVRRVVMCAAPGQGRGARAAMSATTFVTVRPCTSMFV